MWNDDAELFGLMKDKLYTPVVGDILDALGCYHQFLPREIQPMTTDMKIAGRAMPVLSCDVYGEQDKPFGKLTEALDQIEPGEVYIAGGSMSSALWGEILTATARTRGGVGAVVHGPHRDTPQVLEQNWPVFSTGRFAQDSRVRTSVQNYRMALEIEGVWIEPGDLVFGDLDGVLIIPQKHERQVIEQSLEKAATENVVRAQIESGMSSTEAFHRYGVL
jgi:4-hydroxy-4-methyl-2-oxoglutarate aldolase